MYEDVKLVCKECGQEFIFTVQEQEEFAEKGHHNNPSRCNECRMARKARGTSANNNHRSDRALHDAVCANCGKSTQVPFKPRNDRPVYCRDCYKRNR